MTDQVEFIVTCLQIAPTYIDMLIIVGEGIFPENGSAAGELKIDAGMWWAQTGGRLSRCRARFFPRNRAAYNVGD